ncbi:toll/interleukin-1 receptor domain-containing protein [Phycicoccus sp. Root101]|uniref:toll/interleukin-1 receptor domain-containing protein n=1 Tax=Phycicoccus sp. Root101 TaxID=1736421 RepID=UPI000702CA2F|nr:toll/interleukin-1 receptor domain-containing protein [Phycicoccus sp. Root101]KQU68305.1 hypothetical protein ASC58_12210 [Phycicoccus sp. Root101]
MATKVFISWSGDKSRAVALALRTWLPKIIQSVQPFMSSADIAAGSRPMSDIESSLEDAQFGIICVTSDNWERPWLNFEAGAISKRLGLEETRVSPLLVDMKPEDIDSPLKQFQMKHLDERGVFEVLLSLNALCGDGALSEADLKQTFEVWWPKMDADFERARVVTPTIPVHRGQEAKIDELLTLVRGLARTGTTGSERRKRTKEDPSDRITAMLRSLQPELHTLMWSSTADQVDITSGIPVAPETAKKVRSSFPLLDITFSTDDGLEAMLRRELDDNDRE